MPAVSVIVIAIVIAIMSVMTSLFGDEVSTSVPRSLNSIDSVFPLAECMQLFHFVPLKAGRQSLICNIRPRSGVSRSPEPMPAVQVIVAAADKIDVIGNAHCHIRLGLR